MANEFDRLTENKLAELDGLLVAHGSRRWDSFYEDRARPCSFFGTSPDESLAKWVHEGLIRPHFLWALLAQRT
jgi:hypothetical protein